MKIRPFAPEDISRVIDIVMASYITLGYAMDFTEFDRDLASIPETYQGSGGEFWVLEDEGRIAGCVGVTLEDDGRCELHRLYLLPSRRGRGFGRALIEKVVSWCREEGCEELFLWSDVRFTAAREVYMRCGFSPSQETRAIDPVNPESIERCFEMKL